MVHWSPYQCIYPSWIDILADCTDRFTDVTRGSNSKMLISLTLGMGAVALHNHEAEMQRMLDEALQELRRADPGNQRALATQQKSALVHLLDVSKVAASKVHVHYQTLLRLNRYLSRDSRVLWKSRCLPVFASRQRRVRKTLSRPSLWGYLILGSGRQLSGCCGIARGTLCGAC
jgi:hypothetical protein